MTTPPLAARVHRSGTVLAAAITLVAAAVWAAHHGVQAASYGDETGTRLAAVWAITFLILLSQTIMYHCERARRVSPRSRRQLDTLHVAVLLPVYNEDDGYLRLGLASFLAQTRKPDSVHVVDDGSTSGDYAQVRAWWERAAAEAGIATTWQRTPNQGKRHAQAAGVHASPTADVFITVDSDSCLAPNAIEEILLPFARARVQSVAGIVLATNHRANLLTRVTDLWFTTGQLTDRSALSAMGAVLVNSGPLAAYRAGVVRDNLDSYLNETFLGRPVRFSDDSLLTLYALLRGRTVQQPSAMVFTALPEKPSHFGRMYMRWMRGSTIRSIWRMRYLPLTGWAYWAHLLRWFQVALSAAVLGWLLAVEPFVYGRTPPASFLVVPFLIGWAQGLRYLGVIRSDERMRHRAVTWLLMPLAVIGSWTVLRVMRWYGAATCARTGWGTRQNGAEVSLAAAEAPAGSRVVLSDDDTLQIPLVKLLDPETETTLQIAVPVR
ncbi:glycosyltransferase family 2 protein [Streptomyces sp. M2CJ-2]|uniref:glycosyltransferase family 2 protein n=1 Tax=Streptomyces sp. M2CJ-2 TaxID=2803948 RepID=UPI00192619DA|nr:glycosyltransferase [Streptomyces sp. M2CJ-2]MBL3669075.1 glycosyltransferase family 2 protein [Streptomyces sp. M2CJ-2]